MSTSNSSQNSTEPSHVGETGQDKQNGKLTAEAAQLLAEVGFLAIRRNRINEAVLIFNALRHFRPQADYPIIGLALSEMTRNAHGKAIELLHDALHTHPESPELRAFHGLALYLLNRYAESREIVASLIPGQRDPQILQLATTLRDAIDRSISPLDPNWHKKSISEIVAKIHLTES